MKALYDSRTDKLRIIGQRPTSERFWTVQVQTNKGSMTFRPQSKCLLQHLAHLIVDEVMRDGAPEWISWQAVAR